MQYKHVFSRRSDPFIAVGMGLAAYWLHERRQQRRPGHSLLELLTEKLLG